MSMCAEQSGRYKVQFVGNTSIDGNTTYTIKVSNPDGDTWKIEKRYSEIRELHEALRLRHGNILPAVPGKKLFGNQDPAFIAARQVGLQQYLEGVLQIERDVRTFALIQFLQIPPKQGPGVTQAQLYEQILHNMQAKLLNLASHPAPLDETEVNQRLKKYTQAMRLHVLSQPVDPIHLRAPVFNSEPLQLCPSNAEQLEALKAPPAHNDAHLLGELLDDLHQVLQPGQSLVDPQKLIVPFPKVSLPSQA